MKQQEDSLKNLFDGFDPELGDTVRFMSRLETRLDSVEMIRSRSAESRRHYIMAAVIAAFAGFVSGVIIMLLLPHIGLQMLTPSSVATVATLVSRFFEPATALPILLTAALSLFIAVNAYSVTLTALGSWKPKR